VAYSVVSDLVVSDLVVQNAHCVVTSVADARVVFNQVVNELAVVFHFQVMLVAVVYSVVQDLKDKYHLP
jgi:hypothetical protein